VQSVKELGYEVITMTFIFFLFSVFGKVLQCNIFAERGHWMRFKN